MNSSTKDLRKSRPRFSYRRQRPSIGRFSKSNWRYSTVRRISGAQLDLKRADFEYGVALFEEEEEDGSDTDFDVEYGCHDFLALSSIGGYGSLSFGSDGYEETDDEEMGFADAEIEQE